MSSHKWLKTKLGLPLLAKMKWKVLDLPSRQIIGTHKTSGTMVFKTLDIRQQRTVICETWENIRQAI